jgi:hypothetical protein
VTQDKETTACGKRRFWQYLVSGALVFLVIFIVARIGIAPVVTRPQIDQELGQFRSDVGSPSTGYYCGSDDDYDYYAVSNDGRYFDRYRVRRANNAEPDRMPFTRDKTRWRNYSPVLTPLAFPAPITFPTTATAGSASPNVIVVTPQAGTSPAAKLSAEDGDALPPNSAPTTLPTTFYIIVPPYVTPTTQGAK